MAQLCDCCYTRRPISFNSARVIASVERLRRPVRMAWRSLANPSCSIKPLSLMALSGDAIGFSHEAPTLTVTTQSDPLQRHAMDLSDHLVV